MSKLTNAQVQSALVAGGFTPQSAVTLAAIGGAESGYDPNALGDTTIENSVWGPSVGVFQIRTLKAQTGTGGIRDITWLQGSLVHQVQAAWQISSGGRDFAPWSTYTSGRYRQFLGGTEQAGLLSGLGSAAGGALTGTLGDLAAPLVEGVKTTAVEVTFVLLGVGLVAAGVYRTFGAQIRSAVGTAAKVATVAAV